MRTRDTLRQLANAVALPLGVAMNLVYPAVRGFDFGATGAETVAVTPAGWAFGIWGPIFLGHLAYAVYQALPAQRENATLRRVGWYTAAVGAANIGIGALWPEPDSAAKAWSGWVLILASLAALIAVEAGAGGDATPGRDFWLVRVPFSFNLGWISVATIVDTALVLRNEAGWNGAPLAPQLWAAATIVVAAGLAVAMLLTRGNVAYALPIAWGLTGVAVEQSGTPLVPLVAVIGAGSVAVDIIATLFARRMAAGQAVRG